MGHKDIDWAIGGWVEKKNHVNVDLSMEGHLLGGSKNIVSSYCDIWSKDIDWSVMGPKVLFSFLVK